MNFPDTYLEYDDVKISWSHAWGKLEDDLFFTCAHFDEVRDNEIRESTHVSFHDPEPHYYEVTNGGFGTFLNATSYDIDTIRIYIKDKDRYIIHKGHCREHKYSTSCHINVFTDYNSYYTLGWAGYESSNKNWADIIYEEDDKPTVDNWEWLGIKLDSGKDIMVYNTKRKDYCCVIENGKAKRCKEFSYQANYLGIPKYGLNMTIEPIAMEKIFEPELGMAYSEQPFIVRSSQGNGYGIRECTYG